MSVGVETCSPGSLVTELARLMLDRDIDAVVVLDDGHASGIINRENLVQAYTQEGYETITAGEVMREDVPQIPPEIPLTAAAQVMLDQGQHTLYIMHQSAGIEYPAGMISYRHILRHMAARDLEELSDLGINAERRSPLELFIQRRDAARRRTKDSGK